MGASTRRGRSGATLAELLDRLARRARQARVHARLVDHATLGLLRAARVSRRQRALAGGHDPPVPAARGRAVRRGTADEDPRPGGLGTLVPGGRGAARAFPSACAPPRRPARPRAIEALVSTERVLASVIEAVIGACYLAFGYETTVERPWSRRSRRRSRTRSSTRSTSSRRSRSGSPAAARWSATRWSRSRDRRTTGRSRSARTIDGVEVGRGTRTQQEGRRAGRRAVGAGGARGIVTRTRSCT